MCLCMLLTKREFPATEILSQLFTVPSCELSQAHVSPGKTHFHGLSPQKTQEVSLGCDFAGAVSVLLGASWWELPAEISDVGVEAPATFPWWMEENKQQKG